MVADFLSRNLSDLSNLSPNLFTQKRQKTQLITLKVNLADSIII